MNRKLDEILESGALEPSPGFTLAVMERIAELPRPQPVRDGPAWWPWVAVMSGIVFGIDELTSFIFSVWIAVTAN
jgi:hypothetical protein